MTVSSVAGYTHRATTEQPIVRLNLRDERITAALTGLRAARAAYRRAMGANHVGRRGAAEKLADAEAAKDRAYADLEHAVRFANGGADEAQIRAATRHLSL